MITNPDNLDAQAAAADSFLTLPEALEKLALLTSEVETLRNLKEVIGLQAGYISLLEAEITEVVGWGQYRRSSRYEAGEHIRAAIKLAMQGAGL